MKNLFLYILILIPFSLSAQWHDYIWLTSRSNIGGTYIDFKENSPVASLVPNNFPFSGAHVTMSDSSGNLLFGSNGLYVFDKNYQIMPNGDSLDTKTLFSGYINSGSPLFQGALALPSNVNDSIYHFFYLDFQGYSDWFGPLNLFYAKINMKRNNSLGDLVTRDIIALSDTLTGGELQSIKHANGRDWWIVIPKSNSNQYFVSLVDTSGNTSFFSQEIGEFWPRGIDFSTFSNFSPDGKKYIRFNETVGLQIMDFDRCSGFFSNYTLIPFDSSGSYLSGCSISANSKYAYVTNLYELWQYDLGALDIEASKILIDTFAGLMNPANCNFLGLKLAPNNKIYMNSYGGCLNYPAINAPNMEGLSCEFDVYGLGIPAFSWYDFPNYPNYRLGPVDGSACDSLGIDNLCKSDFRYDITDSLVFDIDFINSSYYEPENFWWNFGDPSSGINNTSPLTNPAHRFDSPGVYEVCLTTSSQNNEDIFCRTLYLGVTSTHNLPKPDFCEAVKITISQNQIHLNAQEKGSVYFYDMMGRQKLNYQLNSGSNYFDYNFSSQILFWRFETAEGRASCSGKIFVRD